MWKGKTVSVVFSTFREKESIRRSIDDYFATGFVDEVVVVNNNAEEGTDEEVKKTKARLVHEQKQGYGYGYQRGIREATGDYIFLSEPDGTYTASDIERFLVFTKEFPVVIGTRTNQSSIVAGAAMGFWRKWADVIEGKIIELLFLTNSVTDVGCTCKLLRKDVATELSALADKRCSLPNCSYRIADCLLLKFQLLRSGWGVNTYRQMVRPSGMGFQDFIFHHYFLPVGIGRFDHQNKPQLCCIWEGLYPPL